MKTILLLLTVTLFGCATNPEPVTEQEVIAAIEGFFQALDVENTNPNLIDDFITDDFIIYEFGIKMTKQELLDIISGFPAIESEWKLSDYRISTDINTAHASLFNQGTFTVETDSGNIVQNYEWLESAYLVKVDDQLKIKFYFSDNIGVQ